MSRYLVGRTFLVITKPDRSMMKKEVLLYRDTTQNSIGVKFVGDSPLKGYAFDLMESEIARISSAAAGGGVGMDAVPEKI